MREQDYYAILGIPSTASHGDIRRAFRHLAIRYHPDINKSPDAVVRFQALSQLYRQ